MDFTFALSPIFPFWNHTFPFRDEPKIPRPMGASGYSDSMASAMASILVTLFRLRAVPGTLNSFSTCDQGSLDWPAPLGK